MSFKTRRFLVLALGIWVLPISGYAQDQDVIRVTAGAAFERHDNIFRLDTGVDPTAGYGKSARSETILRGDLGIQFDRELSLQRFRAGLNLQPNKYQNYSRFDHLAYTGELNWDWEISGPLSGRVGARFSRGLLGFNQILVRSGAVTSAVDKNEISRLNPYFTARVRITPSWFLEGSVDQIKVSNSATAFLPGNFTTNGVEAGLRFAPGTGTELSFLGRSARGKYDFLQLTDFLGQNLATGVDNSFKQTEILTRLRVRPSEDTLIAGSIGYTQRKYDAFNQRNFGGLTSELSLDWRPSGGFFMNATLDRSIGLPGVFSANYIDITQLRLAPRLVLTGKTSLTGLVQYATWNYKGDPGIVNSPGLVRKDNIVTLQAGVLYDYSRAISFTADLRREQRTTNLVGADFVNNVIIGGVRGQF
jgi:exopolysaccharide biosynthesis operon protein EpsL